MFNNLNNLLQLGGNLYLTDFLDIFLMSLVIYSILVFMQKARVHMVLLGFTSILLLYSASRFFNLYLTFIAMRYLFGIAAIIFAIIFQSEIRRYFEFLGLIGSRRIKKTNIKPEATVMTEIIQACVRMAQEKIGALIVIQGDDTLDQFIDGGKDLDGLISEELLLSLFDDSSDGHDGAVIVNKNRISKFGAHLPLSTNFKEIGKHGTRHSAALGLSELTDAICIVVSEEKGTISVSKDTKLKKLKKFEYLEKELARNTNLAEDPKQKRSLLSVLTHNFWLKLGALTTTIIIWYLTAYSAGIIQKTYDIPITVSGLAENTLIEEYSPKSIQVTVSGRGERIFEDVTTESFKINYKASTLETGVNKEEIMPKNIVIPSNLTLDTYSPQTFLVTVTKYETKEIPIAVKLVGDVAENMSVTSIVATPEYVEVLIPEGEEVVNEIPTEEIDVSNLSESVIVPAKIIVPESYRVNTENIEVNVAVTIEESEN